MEISSKGRGVMESFSTSGVRSIEVRSIVTLVYIDHSMSRYIKNMFLHFQRHCIILVFTIIEFINGFKLLYIHWLRLPLKDEIFGNFTKINDQNIKTTLINLLTITLITNSRFILNYFEQQNRFYYLLQIFSTFIFVVFLLKSNY